MPLKHLRLSTYVQLLAAFLVGAAVLALGYMAESSQREALLIQAGAQLSDRAQSSGELLRRTTATLREDVLFLAKTPPVSGIVRAELNGGIDPRDGNTRAQWVKRLQEIFAAFATAHGDYFQVRYIGKADQGRELVRVERRDGQVVVTADAELQQKGDRDYVRETLRLQDGQVFISDWNYNRERGNVQRPPIRTLRAATPVFTPTGELFGVIVINYDVGSLLDTVSRLPKPAEAFLADDRGRYLAHPDPARAFGFEEGQSSLLQQDIPAIGAAFDPKSPPHIPWHLEDSFQVPRYITAERIHYDPRVPDRFLLLAYTQAPDAFEADLARNHRQMILRGVVAAVLLGGLILLVLRHLFSPLRQVAAAAKAVAEGSRDVALPVTAGGEVGALARSFAAMVGQVAAREQDYLRLNEDLERRVAERTKELQLAASVVENTSEGVVVTDAKARILSVNTAFTEITGYPAEEAIGGNPRILKSDHQDDAFYRNLWQELLHTGRWQGDIWNRRKSGEAYLERLTINMIRGADGKPLNYVGVFSDVTESRRKDERIRHLAFHDPLTGLPNRFLLTDRLQHAISVAHREGSRLALMFIDLDRFKGVNDSLGHDVGDMLLKEVAVRLKAGLRDIDTVARMGGDEFVALLENVTEPEHCAAIAAKLIENLSRPMDIAGHPIQIGASVGIAFYPEDGGDALELMRQADTAMYVAKNEGRGIFRFFRQTMTEQASRRLKLEIELRRAVERNELELHYQPKVCLAHGMVRGVEALVRWRHPERGLVPPADFIPVAEESGLIVELGAWVLAEAFRQAARWQARDLHLPIAVNVSARQLQGGELARHIADLHAGHAVAPGSIEVELTESTVMTRPDEGIGLLRSLREAGVPIAVDDFGTGYSSLAYLRRLPIDTIKIDRSFVMNAHRHQGDAEIVRTIIALAKTLNLTVVAEGVETAEHAAMLAAAGCDLAQGYWYARPMPAADLAAWLAADPVRLSPCTCVDRPASAREAI